MKSKGFFSVPVPERKIRVLVAKPGLDGHDRGVKIVASALRDAGMEVIYTGLHQSPEAVVATALQEDVDVIGLSLLSGAHKAICRKIARLLREQRLDDVKIVVGGTIPATDAAYLKRLGVVGIFGPGSPTREIVEFVRRAAESQRVLRMLTRRSARR
jgi:methylmalonyl-CoA mutase C-terminal domain/subunit